MRKSWVLIAVLCAAGAVAAEPESPPVFDLHRARKMTLAEIAPQLIGTRIVVVGEQHTRNETTDELLQPVRRPAGT